MTSSSIKLLLISAAVVSVAVTMKLAVPLIFTFAVNGLPAIWTVVVTWLKPPYLYVVINGIIITIAASTRFQHNQHQENQSQPQVFNAPNSPPPSDLTSDSPPAGFGVVELPPVTYETVEPSVAYESKQSDVDLELVKADGGSETIKGKENDFVTRSTWHPSEGVVDFPVKEKQLVTSRFTHNRKPVKANPEGTRALRVLKPKKHETLESTWKMITDGRQLPLTRHLRKSDTFDNLHHERPSEELTPAAKRKTVKKSETFKERTTYANQNDDPQPPAKNSSSASVEKLKKDVSLGHDELNRRVEAFIKKFNDDMRLQRQESLKHYMEMVKGGAR